jgi:peptidoglycan/LPS O-acetylase OafA/YrhL
MGEIRAVESRNLDTEIDVTGAPAAVPVNAPIPAPVPASLPGPGAAPHRIDDIEVLRAFAVVSVILWHAAEAYTKPGWLTWQILGHKLRLWDGVDLFLVISGFVIGRGLLVALAPAMTGAQRRDVVLRFWGRRAWRLWPAAWLWLAVVLGASLLVHLPQSLGTPRENLWGAISAIGLFANLRFAFDTAQLFYFGGAYPYWSLSLEEQFYLLLPLLMLASKMPPGWAPHAARPWLLPSILIGGILLQWPLDFSPWIAALRTAALLWGVLLSLAERSPAYRALEPRWLLRSAWLRLAVTGALLFLLVHDHGPGVSQRFDIGNIALIAAALVWLASYDRGYICPWHWPKPVLLWVGSRSYVLYLCHVPVGILVAHLHAGLWGIIPVHLLALYTAAEATHRFVEQPGRRFGRAWMPMLPHRG